MEHSGRGFRKNMWSGTSNPVTMSDSSDSPPLPDSKGPRLFAFSGKLEDIRFLGQLSPEKNDLAGGDVPHSRVFLISLGNQRYALKVVSSTGLRDTI